MNAVSFAIPGDINTVTGGYIYDRRVMAELAAAGMQVEHIVLPASFPFPDDSDIAASQTLLNARNRNYPAIIDGLAFGALPHERVRQAGRGLIALCHHPLGFEAGLSAADSARLLANEKSNLAFADHVIVTSTLTAATLRESFSVPAEKITIAEPGCDPRRRSTGSRSDMVELMSTGSLVERKGFDILLAALAGLQQSPWRLRIAGSQQRSPRTAKKIRDMIIEFGLQDRVQLLGECPDSELDALYQSSDVFVLSSLYEGYGMVLAEAMASGLAIISTTGGAAAATVPDNAALKVPPGDSAALRQALGNIIGDRALRHKLADASWRAGQHLPRWPQTATIVAGAVAAMAKKLNSGSTKQ